MVHISVFRSCRVVLNFLFPFVENALDDSRGTNCSFILAPLRRDGNFIQYFREFARVSMPATAPLAPGMLANATRDKGQSSSQFKAAHEQAVEILKIEAEAKQKAKEDKAKTAELVKLQKQA